MLALALFGPGGPAVAQVPPPEALGQMLEVLSDPEVKAWLEAQANTPPVVPATSAASDLGTLSQRLDMIRAHGEALIGAFPAVPAQFERARDILLIEFNDEGLFVILALIASFIAGGMGLDWLVRLMTGSYRDWMKSIPMTNPHGRLRALGARILYAALLIAAFVIGSGTSSPSASLASARMPA